MPLAPRSIAGRNVNPIGLGAMSMTWAYGGAPAEEDALAMLNRALDLGYDHIDTARIYGEGKNEELIGKALAGRRNQFFLASKTGIFANGPSRGVDCRPETIRTALETSLQTLKTDHIDLYYLHRRDFKVPIEESVGALADLRREGKIGGIGLSEMSADTVRRAAAETKIDALQNEFSPWTRNPELGALAACAELGITLVAFSPVGRGALTGTIKEVAELHPSDFRQSMPRFSDENWPHNRALIDEFSAIATAAGVTPAQLCLGWVLAQGPHVVAIPGTMRDDHLAENIARWDWEIPADVAASVDRLINNDTVRGHRYSPMMAQTIDTEDYADA